MRFSTWNTPRFITGYQEDIEWLHLPRGLLQRVTTLVGDLGSRLDMVDDRADPPGLGLGLVGALRAQQAAAVCRPRGSRSRCARRATRRRQDRHGLRGH